MVKAPYVSYYMAAHFVSTVGQYIWGQQEDQPQFMKSPEIQALF